MELDIIKTTLSVLAFGVGYHKYMLSLLEAYTQDNNRIPSVILVKDLRRSSPGTAEKAGEICTVCPKRIRSCSPPTRRT